MPISLETSRRVLNKAWQPWTVSGDATGPSRPTGNDAPIARPPSVPAPLARALDRLEARSRGRAFTDVPLGASLWLAQQSAKTRAASCESLAFAKGVGDSVWRVGRFALVTGSSYFALNNSSMVASGLIGLVADAGVRELARKKISFVHPATLQIPSVEEGVAAPCMPGALSLSEPSAPRRLAPHSGHVVAARAPSAIAQAPEAWAFEHIQFASRIRLTSRAMAEASLSINQAFGSSVINAQANLAVLPSDGPRTFAWYSRTESSCCPAQAAGKLAAVGQRSRAQVHRLRALAAAQEVGAIRALHLADLYEAKHRQIETVSEPTVFYKLLCGGVVMGGAIILGAALGVMTSLVFVFPAAYWLMQALMAKTQQDADAEAKAAAFRQERDRWLGLAHGHAQWALRCHRMAQSQASLWQQTGQLSAELRPHLHTEDR